jgi:hypothetical protein
MKNQNTYSNKTKEDLEAASTISLKIGLTASLIKPAIYHTEGEYTCHWSPRPYPLFLCLCTGKIPPGFGALQLWIKL